MIRKIKITLIGLGFLGTMLVGLSAPVLAATCDPTQAPPVDSGGKPVACDCPKSYGQPPTNYDHPLDANGQSEINTCAPDAVAVKCTSGQIDSQDPTKCAPLGNGCNGNSQSTCLQQNPIVKNLDTIVNFISGAVGIIVTAVIILGGIQYSMAGDNPQAVTAAKQRITNGLLALVVFFLTYAFLQWIVPGGVFNS